MQNDSGTVRGSNGGIAGKGIRGDLIVDLMLDQFQVKILDDAIINDLIGSEVTKAELSDWFPDLWTDRMRTDFVHTYNSIVRRIRKAYKG
jgi:hypothetical protein